MTRKFLFVLAVFCVCASCAAYGSVADDAELFSLSMRAQMGDIDAVYTIGVKALQQEKYEGAFTMFKLAAEKGHVQAQYYLGTMYHNGQGTERNYEKAFEWFEIASAAGNLDGTYGLAFMYNSGNYISKDVELAKLLWREAALKGHKNSQQAIGLEVITAEELGVAFNQNKLKFKKTYGSRKIIVRGKVNDVTSEIFTDNAVVELLASTKGYTNTYVKCIVKEEIPPREAPEGTFDELESEWEPMVFSVKKGNYATIEGTLSSLGVYSIEIKDCVILSVD